MDTIKQPIIILGSDHGGFAHKQAIIKWLEEHGYQFEDVGAHQFDAKDDYPQFALAVAQRVAQAQSMVTQPPTIGIVTCRSAGGVTIAVNKVVGIRGVTIFDEKSAVHAKEHNDANIVTLSGDWTSQEQAVQLVQIFLNTQFTQAERHIRRLAQISEFEKQMHN